MEEVRNEIKFHYDEVKRVYELITSNGKSLEQEVDEFIAEHQHKDMVLLTDVDYSALRKQRTLINNKMKELQKVRKQVVGVLTGNLTAQSIALEKKLGAISSEMTTRLNEYKNEVSEVEQTFSLVIKGSDKDAIEKVKKLANELKLEVEEK